MLWMLRALLLVSELTCHVVVKATVPLACLTLDASSQEPFTYIDRVGEDKEHFLRWVHEHEERMRKLQEATSHMWFQAYCMLNKVPASAFVDPIYAVEMLSHWQYWVAEQDPWLLHIGLEPSVCV